MQRILAPGRADQTIDKSRFIAVAEYCASEREVALLLRRLAAEHAHAHHLVFAYRVAGPQGWLQRFHDAGEPSGTAGKPVMQHLEGRNLVNACVAVVRYYGGVKLGTGGLARAYGNTARLALEAAQIGPYVEMREFSLAVDYARLDALARAVEQVHGCVLDKQFAAQVTVRVSVPAGQADALQQRFAPH